MTRFAIDNPKGITQYGGTVAAPIAKNVLKSAISILDIEPTTEGMTREYTWLDTKYVLLPNVVGMNVSEAKKTLKGFTIEYSGIGENVIYQSPQANYFIKEGGTVVLMLSN